MKFLILGHARHGKDTVSEMLKDMYGLTSKNSSTAAAEIFIYDVLKDKYGYKSADECFEDRINHRPQWFDLIVDYNREDKARLAKEILKNNDIYGGMRSDDEIQECIKQELFDFIVGVYDPRKPLEPLTSFNIDLWKVSDFVIPNAGTLEDLRRKLEKIFRNIK